MPRYLFQSDEDRQRYIEQHGADLQDCCICKKIKPITEFMKGTELRSKDKRWTIERRCKQCRREKKTTGKRTHCLIPYRFCSWEEREQWAATCTEMFICRRCREPKGPLKFKRMTLRVKTLKETTTWWKFESTCRACETKDSIERQRRCEESIDGSLSWRLISLRGRAKKRGLPFDLAAPDLVECWNKQKGLCFYSGRPLTFGSTRRGETSKDDFSVDRIDSNRGYVRGNIVLCCRHVNTMKSDLSLDDFAAILTEIYQRKEIWNAKH